MTPRRFEADLFQGFVNGVPEMERQLKGDLDKEISRLREIGEAKPALKSIMDRRIYELVASWQRYEQAVKQYREGLL